MNQKKHSFKISLVHELMFSIIGFSIMYAFLQNTLNNPGFNIRWLLIFFVPPAIYAVNLKIKHFFILILYFLIIIGGCLLTVPSNIEKFIYAIYLAVVLIRALYLIFASQYESSSNMSVLWVIVILATQFIYDIRLTQSNKILFFIMTSSYLILYFLEKYFRNFGTLLNSYSETKSFPLRELKSLSSLLVFSFLIITIFITSLLSRIFLNIDGIKRFFYNFFSWLLSLLKYVPYEHIPQEPPEFDGSVSPLNIILFIFVVIFLIFIFIVAIINIHSFIIKFYSKKGKKYNIYEFVSPFPKVENISYKKEKHSLFRKLFKLNNSEKIRKFFYTFVVKNSSGISSIEKLTPSEIIKVISSKKLDNISSDKIYELLYYYEKARYSPEICSKEDVLKVKELLKAF